ncbi:hypothetical protein H0H81_006141 [Sphagnurus paluster]|uniref:Intradiol ring-cleavage dioxygenases domain-containing protein n=1 Tax=Sphagnurus paluster TaxID=117069 RepID=A0A9P7FXQ0_9AGAR|nr:hypothetical protein H0H81_006141 [Sphagnurus paluster]
MRVAHPGGDHDHGTPAERAQKEASRCLTPRKPRTSLLTAFQAESTARHLQARKCAPAIAAFETQRMLKRNRLSKRMMPPAGHGPHKPHYETIQNTTCVTAPEVIEGPYYINNEYVRTDLTETQRGVKIVLDIGVMDTTTCKPLPNAFVEIWAANATGQYGGFSTGDNANVHTETFLRGGYYTNAQGIVELVTLYPGFYDGRTAHIHTMIHKDWKKNANGTLVSHAGSVVHIGQFFFEESWNDKVYETLPYTSNKQGRTLNTEDIFISNSTIGYKAFIDLQMLGHDIREGVLGYISEYRYLLRHVIYLTILPLAVGVDSTKSYSIWNENFL